MTAFIVIAACMALAAASAVAWPLLRGGAGKILPLASSAAVLVLSGLLYVAWSSWDWSGQKQIPPEGAEVAATADDEAPGQSAWVAALADSSFHAHPFEPGQRVGMRWPEAEAHLLAA